MSNNENLITMKTKKLSFAVIAMAIVVIAVTVVSCKKDNENMLNHNDYTIWETIDIRQIEDMSSYLKDFKKKMMESKEDEALNLADAAWHLACLGNFDHCRVNMDYNEVKFDTIEIQVNTSDGIMLLKDLNTTYEQMCNEIQQFKKGFAHNNENLYYLNVSISAQGNAKIALMTTYRSLSKYITDHTWYYGDPFIAFDSCEAYFDDNTNYPWNGSAVSLLQSALNSIEHHENDTIGPEYSWCYTPTRDYTFDYTNSIDPYHSDFYDDSRVFAKRTNNNHWSYNLDFVDMCYCLDSYLGLGYGYINNAINPHERPVCWTVKAASTTSNNSYWYYHRLHVDYGNLIPVNPGNDD